METLKLNKILQGSFPDNSSGGRRPQSQLINDFVSKQFQEASLKLCLLSHLCIQPKSQSQPKKFQSEGCQCLFTVRESAGTLPTFFKWERKSKCLSFARSQDSATGSIWGHLSITTFFVAIFICINVAWTTHNSYEKTLWCLSCK